MENSKVEKAKPRLMLRSKSVLIPMITFGALLICYGAYVFWYVSGQENYYNDRAFRVLSVLNQRFHDSVEVRIQDVLGAATENPRRKDLGVGNAGSTGPVGSLEGFVADTLEPYGVTLENIKTDWEGTCKKAHRDGEISLIEGGSAGPFSLTAEYSFQVSSDQGCSGAGKISAPLQPDAVIRPQFEDLEEGFFDDVFIADESGRVLYQQSTGGDRVAWLNELVRYKPDGTALIPLTADFSSAKGTTPFAAASGSSTIRDVDIAGASYKLYLQPSTAMIHKDSLPRTLVLCGLRSTKRFNADKLSLPGADVILGVLTLLSILALGWPFLMMACVSPKQRMSRVQFLLLVVSFLVAGATLAADALNVTYFLAENAESRDHLQLLAI